MKREQARELREVATTIRAKAAALDDDVVRVSNHYPQTSDGVWVGPAADEFYTQLAGVKTALGNIKTDVDGFAASCVRKAGQLERQADAQEAAELAAEDAP